MMIANLIPLLLLGVIVWFVASRGRSGRRSAHDFALDDTIPYPTRQLDADLSLWGRPTGSARNMPQPLRWVISGFAIAILALVVLDFVLRFALPMSWQSSVGYLAMLVLAGNFLPALQLPALGLGQPGKRDGKAPPGAGILTVLLLALLANGPVWRAVRAMEFYTFDPRVPEDAADIVFAGLLATTLVAVVLRLLADRKSA